MYAARTIFLLCCQGTIAYPTWTLPSFRNPAENIKEEIFTHKNLLLQI